jgi:hypothetical protein
MTVFSVVPVTHDGTAVWEIRRGSGGTIIAVCPHRDDARRLADLLTIHGDHSERPHAPTT